MFVAGICLSQSNEHKGFFKIYAHSVSRISSRDHFVEHIVKSVGFHQVGRVGSEPSIRVKDVFFFKATTQLTRDQQGRNDL
jgi:hypothetical protein